MQWFKWHDGTAADPKFRVAAQEAGAAIAEAVAVWAAVLEGASRAADRGAVNVDTRILGAMFDLDPAKVGAILEAFESIGLIADGRVASWDKRQKKPDDSKERVRRYRERQKQDAAPSSSSERKGGGWHPPVNAGGVDSTPRKPRVVNRPRSKGLRPIGDVLEGVTPRNAVTAVTCNVSSLILNLRGGAGGDSVTALPGARNESDGLERCGAFPPHAIPSPAPASSRRAFPADAAKPASLLLENRMRHEGPRQALLRGARIPRARAATRIPAGGGQPAAECERARLWPALGEIAAHAIEPGAALPALRRAWQNDRGNRGRPHHRARGGRLGLIRQLTELVQAVSQPQDGPLPGSSPACA